MVAIPLARVAPRRPAPAAATEPAARRRPPLEVSAPEPLEAGTARGAVAPPTLDDRYGEIVLAADAAVEAGVEDDVVLEPEPLDELARGRGRRAARAAPRPAARRAPLRRRSGRRRRAGRRRR